MEKLERRIKRILKNSLIIGGCLLGSLSFAKKSEAIQFNEFPIATDVWDQNYPSISGFNVAFRDLRTGGEKYNIYIKNIQTNTEVSACSHPGKKARPDINNDRVVFHHDMTEREVFMYTISTGVEERITPASPETYINPRINGDRIVYSYGSWAVGMYDINTGISIPISSNTDDNHLPEIYRDIIVWNHLDAGLDYDIYLRDLRVGVEERITFENTAIQNSPKIWGKYFVWQDDRNGPFDIYLYGLGDDGFYGTADDTGQIRFTDNPNNQMFPAIYGDWVVYQDDRKGNWDIYAKRISTGEEYQITSDSANQINPDISGKILVWEDYRNGVLNGDIYGARIDDTLIPLYPIVSLGIFLGIGGLASLSLSYRKREEN